MNCTLKYISFVILQLIQIKTIESFSPTRISSSTAIRSTNTVRNTSTRSLQILSMISKPPTSQKKDIIIAGAGIHGTSTAYYLAQNAFPPSLSLTHLEQLHLPRPEKQQDSSRLIGMIIHPLGHLLEEVLNCILFYQNNLANQRLCIVGSLVHPLV